MAVSPPLNSLLNFQIVQVCCLFCNFRPAELLALSIHLLLRSAFKLVLLQIKSEHSTSDKRLLAFVCVSVFAVGLYKVP